MTGADAAPPTGRAPVPAAVIQRAAEWMARLWSGHASEADREACRTWRAAHPDHEHAWRQLESFERQLTGVPQEAAHGVLVRSARNAAKRRRALQALGVLAMGGGTAWLLRDSRPWGALAAAHRTGVGETLEMTLPDGTSIQLDTASAIDLHVDAQQSRVVLRSGAVLVARAQDAAHPPQPLSVETREGSVRVLGARFSVRQDADSSLVCVFGGAAEIQPAGVSAPGTRCAAGHRNRFTASAVLPAEVVSEDAAAWSRGLLLAEQMRLADVLAELARYRRGVLRCDEDIADLRVTGVFSLRETDRALASLALSLGVELRYVSRFWVTVQRARIA